MPVWRAIGTDEGASRTGGRIEESGAGGENRAAGGENRAAGLENRAAASWSEHREGK